jgi:hypothetical protein
MHGRGVGYDYAMARYALLLVLLTLAVSAQTSRTPRGKSAPATAPTGEAEIKKLEQQWLDAVGKRDQSAVDALLAPDFRAIAIDGKARDRQQELATLLDTTRPPLTRFFGRLDISFVAPSVALTRGLIVLNGENIREAHFAFTHVWVLRDKKWLALASQETLENY